METRGFEEGKAGTHRFYDSLNTCLSEKGSSHYRRYPMRIKEIVAGNKDYKLTFTKDSFTLQDKARGLFLSGANNGGFAGPCLLSLDERVKDLDALDIILLIEGLREMLDLMFRIDGMEL